MAKLTICAAFLLAAVGGSYAADAWAADDMPTKAPPATTPSTAAPQPCADPADFITTNCQLTWHGITLFGAVDMGFGWQSHGAPFDPISAVSSSYLIQKQNQGSMWTRAANAMSNSFIGIKGNEPIGGDFSVVFDLDAGFDPYSLRLSNGPGSIAANNGVPQVDPIFQRRCVSAVLGIAAAAGDPLKADRREGVGGAEWIVVEDGIQRILSIYGAQRSADRLHGYRGKLSLPGLRGVQQHEYQQCGLWRERPW